MRSPGVRSLRGIPSLTAAILCGLLAFPSAPAQAEAQDLPLKRELPPSAPGPCGSDELLARLEVEPTAAERDRAADLLAEANQAAILGDDARAGELLAEAAALDPGSAEIAYRLGRLLEGDGRDAEAVGEYCRYLLLEPEGADAEDVSDRIERLAVPEEDEIPGLARAAFQQGIQAVDAAQFEDAVLHFSRAIVELPRWPEAHYNRGVAHLRDGRMGAGIADLEIYLEFEPEAPDRDRIEDRIRELDPPSERSYSPGTALATGLLIPGMGHFYSGRTGTGLLVLAGAGAGVATGLLYTEVEIRCLVPLQGGECPADQVSEEVEERPLLVPGLAAAAAIGVLGAIHAWRGIRSDADRVAAGPEGGIRVGLFGAPDRPWRVDFEVAPSRSGGVLPGGITTGVRIRFR